MTKQVSVTLSNDEVKVFNDVTNIDFRDHTIFSMKYKSAEGKRCIALFNLPVAIEPGTVYAKSLTVNFTE